MPRQPLTVGELPAGSPVTVNSDSIVATTDGASFMYWIAPEAIVSNSTDSPLAHGIRLASGGVEITEATRPENLRVFIIEPEDLPNWHIRMLPVNVHAGLFALSKISTYADVKEDFAANVSSYESSVSVVQGDMSDMAKWFGRTPPSNHLRINNSIMMAERMRIAGHIAANGVVPTMFDTDRVGGGQIVRLMHAAFLHEFLDSLISAANKPQNKDFYRFYHACIALYNIMIEGGVILPRQYNESVFDAAYLLAKSMTTIWEIDAAEIHALLYDAAIFGTNDVDKLIVFSEEDSMHIAQIQGLTDKHPDGRFRSFIYRAEGEWAEAMPTADDMKLIMLDYGIDVDFTGIEPETRVNYATTVVPRNSAFRNFVLFEANEAKGIVPSLFDDSDDYWDDEEGGPSPYSGEPEEVV